MFDAVEIFVLPMIRRHHRPEAVHGRLEETRLGWVRLCIVSGDKQDEADESLLPCPVGYFRAS
ncbi:hypothetical protein D3C80_974420 [compost metagenome]